MKKDKILEPCKERLFQEIYRMSDIHVVYSAWESRIKTFFMVIKRAFFILVIAFRILMRISSLGRLK